MNRDIWRIANAVSMGNIIFGTLAVFFALHDPVWSIRFILLAIFCDALDGTVARWEGSTETGKTLDRVGDRITQAIAPAAILAGMSSFHPFALAAGMLFVAVSMVRLVRTDAAQTSTVGLTMWPICFAFLLGYLGGLSWLALSGLLLIGALLSISTIPYEPPWAARKPEVKKHGARRTAGVLLLRVVPLMVLFGLTFNFSFSQDVLFVLFWVLTLLICLWTLYTFRPRKVASVKKDVP